MAARRRAERPPREKPPATWRAVLLVARRHLVVAGAVERPELLEVLRLLEPLRGPRQPGARAALRQAVARLGALPREPEIAAARAALQALLPQNVETVEGVVQPAGTAAEEGAAPEANVCSECGSQEDLQVGRLLPTLCRACIRAKESTRPPVEPPPETRPAPRRQAPPPSGQIGLFAPAEAPAPQGTARDAVRAVLARVPSAATLSPGDLEGLVEIMTPTEGDRQ